MTVLRLTLAAAALSFSAGLAPAATLNGYTSFLAFGDSLTDDGNLYDLTGNTVPPSPPYFDGRFSNGQTWAEHVADRFAQAGLFSDNFAFINANAVDNGDFIPDLPQQLALAAATVPPEALGVRPLVALWFGANDIFTELDKLSPTLEGAVAVAEAAADAVGLGAAIVAAAGINDLILVNLPDLGRIPRFALFDLPDADKATAATTAFNARLARGIAGLRAGGVTVIEVDVNSLFDDLLGDPASFGLTNATLPCFVPGVSLCTPQQALDWAFFDQSHPNARVHAIIAERVLLAAIPLPASALLLGAGLAGLVLLRRRSA